MTKLFRVEVTCEVAVAAETQEEAERMLRDDDVDWGDELGHATFDASEVTSMSQLGDEWRGALPYTTHDDYKDKPCEFFVEMLDLVNGVKK
jgi:hypothetical protein